MSVLSAVRLTPHDEKFWSCIQVPLAQDNEFSSQIYSQKIIVLISILLSLRIIWHNSWNHLRIKEKPCMPSGLRLFCLLLVQHLLRSCNYEQCMPLHRSVFASHGNQLYSLQFDYKDSPKQIQRTRLAKLYT